MPAAWKNRAISAESGALPNNIGVLFTGGTVMATGWFSLRLWRGAQVWHRDRLDEIGAGRVLAGLVKRITKQITVVTIDGVGEWATSSIGVGRGHDLEILHELRFPHSLGLLYSAFTYYTGFKVNSGEYKVMGLAPYGEPKYVKAIKDQPRMNSAFVAQDGQPARIDREDVNFGIAIDIERKDGSRSLVVPNIKRAQAMDFAQFLKAYNDVVRKARNNTLEIADFEGTIEVGPSTINVADVLEILHARVRGRVVQRLREQARPVAVGSGLEVGGEKGDRARLRHARAAAFARRPAQAC